MGRILAATVILGTVCATVLPAQAQWLAVGRWGSEQNFRFVAPGNWMVLNTDLGVEISVDGDNHVTRLTISCTAGDAAARVDVSRYFNYALPRDDGAGSTIVLSLDDHQTSLDMVYSAADERWHAEAALDADALQPFRSARRLTLATPDDTELATYRMNGSGAARDALRRRCGI